MKELTRQPNVGCYIHGLFLEGARWDAAEGKLAESRPKELYTEMAVIWLLPIPNRKPPESGSYLCPIYKTLTRAGRCALRQTSRSTGAARRRGSREFLLPYMGVEQGTVQSGQPGRKDFSCCG